MRHMGTRAMGWLAVTVLALSAGSAMAGKPVGKKELTGVVNLNTATVQQLDLLPGVGQKAAKRIIEHRTKTPFAKVDDLRKVKGFGAKKMEKLKAFLTTTGPTTATVKKVQGVAEATTAPGRRAPNR